MNSSIVVIGSKLPSDKNSTGIITRSLREKKITVHELFWENLLLELKTSHIEVSNNGQSLIDYQPQKVLMFGWYRSAVCRELAFATAQYLQSHATAYWNSEALNQRATGKLSCLTKLALENIPITETVFSLNFEQLMSAEHTFPLVLKASRASRGERNFFVKDRADLSQYAYVDNNDLMMQPFFPNDHDLRVICYDSETKLILKRSRPIDSMSHLNNTSAQGRAQWIPLTEVSTGLLSNSKKICKILNREMCGIDWIPDKKASFGYSCLEVNAIPQLTSGHDVATKMDALAESLVTKPGKNLT